MAATLTVNEDNGLYRLNLDHAELLLIAKFVSHVRLGDDNEYSVAAFNLSAAISSLDDTVHDAAMDEIGFNVVLENENSETVAIVDGSDSIIEVFSNYDEDLQDV